MDNTIKPINVFKNTVFQRVEVLAIRHIQGEDWGRFRQTLRDSLRELHLSSKGREDDGCALLLRKTGNVKRDRVLC